MKRPNQLIPFTKFPSNRLIATLALILAILRHQCFLRERFQKVIASVRRGFHIARLLGLVVSHTSEDFLTYLQPSLNPRVTPRTSLRQNSYSYPYRGRPHSYQHSSTSNINNYNTQSPSPSPSPSTSQSQVPRSLRRILRLASSPEGLVILHNLAGGLARGVARELRDQRQDQRSTSSSDSSTRVSQNSFHQKFQLLLEMLASPSGQSILSSVVSTGVREAVMCFLQHQETHRKKDDISLPNLITEAVLSDRGRKLVVEVATGVTRTAVPLLLQQQEEQQFIRNDDKTDLQVTTVQAVPSTSTLSPVASPLVKRPLSFTGHSRLASPMTQTGDITPVTKHLVHSIMQAQGRTGLVERLALLAIRDKELVREVVRTVVGEAVRTYLTTKSALQGDNEENDEKECDKEKSTRLTTKKPNNCEANDTQANSNIPKSLWKVLIKSAIIDLKREMINRGSAQSESKSGWVIF